MSRVRTLALACLTLAWLILSTVARCDEPKDIKPIASAEDMERTSRFGPIHLTKVGVVIRSAEELVAQSPRPETAKDPKVQKEMEAEMAKVLKVDAIDWKKQMILGVVGYDFDSLKTDAKTLTASYAPFNEPVTRAIPKTPKIVVLIERFDGEVKFVPKK
ncbi:MAG TPA: hypothetical protein VHR66_25430 [Gemmataceae bacterium]|jgi:hypothetical protein|nr:hypothetical protein [Gemmataceae bacterium]